MALAELFAMQAQGRGVTSARTHYHVALQSNTPMGDEGTSATCSGHKYEHKNKAKTREWHREREQARVLANGGGSAIIISNYPKFTWLRAPARAAPR